MAKQCCSVACVTCLVLTRLSGVASAGVGDEATCNGEAACATDPRNGSYIWPMARGRMGSHGTSPHKGVSNLSASLAWTWHHPHGRFASTSNGALLVDDKGDLYVGFWTGIHKFTADGTLVWRVEVHANDVFALMDGALYTTSLTGHFLAINMDTGTFLWRSDHVCNWPSKSHDLVHSSCDCSTIHGDIGAVAAHRGVVIGRTHEPVHGGACRIAGLNATTGAFLWDFAADHLVWNFYPQLNEDDGGDTFLFQDSTGGVYRIGLDGRLVWKVTNSERWRETWTDGGLQLGPNGVAYVVKSLIGANTGPGVIRAYRIDDGTFLWESPPMPEPPNSWPVIGRMREDDPLTVIAPYGIAGGLFYNDQLQRLFPASLWPYIMRPVLKLAGWFGDSIADLLRVHELKPGIWGLDAETGSVLWRWSTPPWKQGYYRGDLDRIIAGTGLCVPNPCGNPTLDAAGNLYVGMLDGVFYRLVRDADGIVRTASAYDTEAAFSNGGTTITPGMVAIVNCNTLFVFKK